MKFKRIYLELSNYCNLNCVFCTPSNKNSRMIDLSLARRAIDEASFLTKEMCFHVLGEPLIYPRFFELTDYLTSKKMNLMLSTNTRLIERNKAELLKREIKTWNLSLHSIYDMNNKFDYIIKLLNFIDLYQHNHESVFHLRLWADSNQTIKKSNDEIKKILFTYYDYKGEDLKRIRLKERIILSYEEEFIWPSLKLDYNHEGYCLGGKTHIAILADGRVVMCCLDANGDTLIGNIKEKSLQEIIEDTPYQTARKYFSDNKCYFELCKHCSYKDR